jgi:hypothetical protein
MSTSPSKRQTRSKWPYCVSARWQTFQPAAGARSSAPASSRTPQDFGAMPKAAAVAALDRVVEDARHDDVADVVHGGVPVLHDGVRLHGRVVDLADLPTGEA